MCHKYPCHREVWAFPSERLQPCLMPRMGIPETETWDPEKEISPSQTVSLLCCKQPSSSWLSWSHRVTQHHHQTAQAAGGSRQSQLYLPSFPQRRRPLANDKKTHVYLDVLNQLKSWLIFASKHEANRRKKKKKRFDILLQRHNKMHYWLQSIQPQGVKKLLWFGVLVCSFFSLFHKPEAEILVRRVIGQHRAGNKSKFRKSSTLCSLAAWVFTLDWVQESHGASRDLEILPPDLHELDTDLGQGIWDPPFSHLYHGGK